DDYEAGVAQLKTFLGNFRHGAVTDLESYLYTLLGRQAIEHVFRVSTGLDSMLIGEAEILGQVKDAYIQAQQAHSLGRTLHKLFREALHAGKAARTKTRIGEESMSLATAAVETAKARLGSLRNACVLVIGAGKMGRATAKRLRAEGVANLIVTNRTMRHAQDVIAEIGLGHAVEMPGLIDALAASDIVVTSTGASHFIVTEENVRAALARRPRRELVIIDIAVPRDADPAIASLAGVTLVDVDGLRSVVDEKMEVRREAIPNVEAIIAQYIERFGEWYRSRVAIPAIASLTQKAEAIREAELERLFARCPDLTERERQLIVGMSMTIISKLLHTAVTKIRDKAVNNHAEALTHVRLLDELFELNLADHLKALVPSLPALDVDE
ncbi:MAG: glutamyl-tRNA reductase, partial [Candidatus Eremiobacteraeota bacterium]|nr:glutamyl-tRNA reductase [Candidatus Eremiobacteraeota bacterium]